jgi:hypothetical protein
MILDYTPSSIQKVINFQTMTSTQNTQLTFASGYNAKDRIIFSEPVCGEIPDSKPKIEFKRINISTMNEDGSIGELIIPTERLYSFGVSENKSMETGKVSGYTFPLCLWNRDGPTKKEKEWTDTFDSIVDVIIDHLVENKEDIDMFDLTRNDLTKSKGGLNPLYWKKEKAKDEKTGKMTLQPVPGTGPTLYTKLIHSRKNDKFVTQFYSPEDDTVNAEDLMGKHCYAQGAVKIESIFIGSRISLQVKLYEAVVEPTQTGMKRLLARPKANSAVIEAAKNQTSSDLLVDDSDSDSDYLDDSDLEVEEKPKTKVVRKVVRRVKKT